MTSSIALINFGLDLGGKRRGTSAGPAAVGIAGLRAELESLGHTVTGNHTIATKDVDELDPGDPKAKYLPEISEACGELAELVANSLTENTTPVVIGGDHSIACGSVGGVSRYCAPRGEDFGLIWFDAHGDMNTPQSTVSGNVHGMPLASILGQGPDALVKLGADTPMANPAKTVIIGVRDLDDRERNIVTESGARVITMREIDVRGMHACAQEAIDIATEDTIGFHLSFDVDGCDPTIAPGVGTPVKGGVNLRESHLFMEEIAESQKMLSLEFTEINPILDIGNQTAELAVGLCASAFGKRILG